MCTGHWATEGGRGEGRTRASIGEMRCAGSSTNISRETPVVLLPPQCVCLEEGGGGREGGREGRAKKLTTQWGILLTHSPLLKATKPSPEKWGRRRRNRRKEEEEEGGHKKCALVCGGRRP